jgi:hypothetical protein
MHTATVMPTTVYWNLNKKSILKNKFKIHKTEQHILQKFSVAGSIIQHIPALSRYFLFQLYCLNTKTILVIN